MKVSQAFPSNYLKSEDLDGRDVHVWINSVSMEEIGQGNDRSHKLVLKFKGKQKSMVCNKTNATTISKLYGDDTDDWIGKPITLCAREIEYQGEMVLGLRVSLKAPPTGQPAATHHNLKSPPPQQPEPEEADPNEPPF